MFKPNGAALAVACTVLIATISTSCGDDEENTVCIGDESVIVDVAAGSMWIYKVTDYDTLNHVIRTAQDTVLIVKDTVIEGDPWFVTSIDRELWVNLTDGFWVWKEYNDDVSQPYLMIKYPANQGSRYPIPVEDIFPDTMTVADITAETSVPYGTFDAITYRMATYQDSLLSLGYYVRGIGKVREIVIPDRQTRFVLRTLELLKFTSAGC